MKTHLAPIPFLLLIVLMLATSPSAQAQEFSIGSDVMSRYVWRGSDFGESVSLQPGLSFAYKGFEIGSWASYSVAADGSGANEHDIWLSYTVESESAGSLSLGVTDYYFPSPGGVGFFDFSGDGEGAHWVEPFLAYSGPESFPVSLYAALFAHNDPDNSTYVQAGYAFAPGEIGLDLTVGAVTGESAFYGTDGFALVNIGLTASKQVSLTDRFSIPLSVSYILNPDTERTFLVFGLSF